MERNELIIQPPLGICEQPECSLNATICCKTHLKRVCNTCSVIFHYDCKLEIKMKNYEEYMQSAVGIIEYLVDNTLDEGIRYGLHRNNMEFEGSMKDIKHKAKEFIKKYNEIKDDACAIFLCDDESRKLTKEILESHAYHMFSFYKSRIQDSNKLSKAFDEEEAEFYDNIRVQLHQKAIKAEQKFRENTLKSLSKDMMTTFNRSKQNMKSEFALLKDEYQQRFEALESRLVQEARLDREEIRSAKQELLELINKIEGEENTKINDIKKDLNQLTEDTNKDRLFYKSIFEDIFKRLNESNDEKIELSKKIDEVSSNLSIKIKSLEANDHDLLNRTKDLDKRLTFTNKDLSDSIISADILLKDYQNLKKAFEEYKVSIKDTLSNFENKIDASHKEITKSNDIFVEFKTESCKQFSDLKNKQIVLNDEFEESKKNLKKVKEELSQKITSEISTLSTDMKNKFNQMDIKHQNLLQETSNLNIKIDGRTKTSGNNC